MLKIKNWLLVCLYINCLCENLGCSIFVKMHCGWYSVRVCVVKQTFEQLKEGGRSRFGREAQYFLATNFAIVVVIDFIWNGASKLESLHFFNGLFLDWILVANSILKSIFRLNSNKFKKDLRRLISFLYWSDIRPNVNLAVMLNLHFRKITTRVHIFFHETKYWNAKL